LDPSQPENDTIFIDAIAKYPNIILGSSFDSSGNIHTPFSAIKKRTYSTGFLHPNIEKSNKTVYSFSPALQDASGEWYEHFALQILKGFYRYIYDDTMDIPFR